MIRSLISIYLPSYPRVLVYMLQSTEYEVGPYLRWCWRTKDFTTVMKRRILEKTKPAKLLLLALYIGILLQIALGLLLIYLGIWHQFVGGIYFGLAIVIAYPFIWSHLIVLPLVAGRLSINSPANKQAINNSERLFNSHKAIKVAVTGSYGKTTMKELLATVLSEGKSVAATPANKNVSISHAKFAQKLNGNEEILIIEYGEGAPGDIARFSQLTHPTHAVITGLAPAHLDRYKTLQAAGEDIFSIADYMKGENVYVNEESPAIKKFIKPGYNTFNQHEVLGWKIEQIEIDISGTRFSMINGKKTINLSSGLIGRHQIGFLAFVAAFAMQLGLSHKQVKTGLSKTTPYEHRMQPYQLAGANIIDDTYNGNLEGIRAGTQLLADLDASRKIYVTPGLVDQGVEKEKVHIEVGKLIAKAQPNLVVLMQNSVTEYIKEGLKQGEYNGETKVETDPLNFYTNLNHFVASGDLVVMQNDWTDNYS